MLRRTRAAVDGHGRAGSPAPAHRPYAFAVAAVRVLFVDLPPLLRDLVASAFGEQADMQVVDDPRRLADATEPGEAALAIVTAVDDVEALLRARPRLRVLLVEEEGRTGTLYELRVAAERVGELSPELLRGFT